MCHHVNSWNVFTFSQVHNLVAIELAYINTKHPDFTDAAQVSASVNSQQVLKLSLRLSLQIQTGLVFVLSSLLQAEAGDGGKRWKNEKMPSEEKGPVPAFGSPTKAINLLDTVRLCYLKSTEASSTCTFEENQERTTTFGHFSVGRANIPQTKHSRAEGL